VEGEQVTPERWQKQVDPILREAFKLPLDQRRQFVETACAGDRELQDEIEALLRADELAGPMDGTAFDALNTQQVMEAVDDWDTPRKPEKGDMERCKEGHFYDPTKHTTCPHCPIAGLVVDKTVPVSPKGPGPNAQDPRTSPGGPSDEGVTVPHYKAKLGIDPVVGWLVCIQGPDRGRDFRIKSQQNFIGRDQSMDIMIASDEQISRQKHAVITFDPRANTFWLERGDSKNLAYLNGQPVMTPVALKAYDLIELGQSHLRFVPFSTDQFTWE
jgi:hypothetical protein